MGYGQYHRNPLTKEWESPSDELKRAYASLVRIIKSRSVRLGRKNIYWIGQRTNELLDAKELYMPLLRR